MPGETTVAYEVWKETSWGTESLLATEKQVEWAQARAAEYTHEEALLAALEHRKPGRYTYTVVKATTTREAVTF